MAQTEFRQLCQNWLKATNLAQANAIADDIDDKIVSAGASSDFVRWTTLSRQIDDLPIRSMFINNARGKVLDRKRHPKLSGLKKSAAAKKEETANV